MKQGEFSKHFGKGWRESGRVKRNPSAFLVNNSKPEIPNLTARGPQQSWN